MSNTGTYVYVYGTLRKNMGNHRLLENSKYIGTYILEGYKMYAVSSFPGVINTGAVADKITCELYCVDEDTLKRLDRLEGYNKDTHTGMYLRKSAKHVPDLPYAQYFIYEWNYSVKGVSVIEDGDYTRFVSSNH